MKRIALDVRLTRQMSVGMKTYARELAQRLPSVAREYQFITFSKGKNFDWNEQIVLPARIAKAQINLTHYLAHYIPWFAPKPYIVTIHDLIHLRFPHFYKSKVGPYYRIAVKRACANAARVITDDERTVADLERFLGINPEKVHVIPLAVGAPFVIPTSPDVIPTSPDVIPTSPDVIPTSPDVIPTSPDVIPSERSESRNSKAPSQSYIMYVGNHREHKNLVTLFDAWSSLPEKYSIDLLVTGPDDFEGELQRRAALPESRAAGRRIIALGDVQDEELAMWYRGATALVHPALCEGFGLPLLEAMACGCPVVVSADSVPRVLESASLVFPTRDAAALREQLVRLLGDAGLRERLVNDGYRGAQTYTWDRCARATANVYREVLEENSRQ